MNDSATSLDETVEFVEKITGLTAKSCGVVGTVVSLIQNPLVEHMGVYKGILGHLMVGGGTQVCASLASAAFAIPLCMKLGRLERERPGSDDVDEAALKVTGVTMIAAVAGALIGYNGCSGIALLAAQNKPKPVIIQENKTSSLDQRLQDILTPPSCGYAKPVKVVGGATVQGKFAVPALTV